MIIGLTGPNAAGKGTVAEYLVIKGYKVYSLSNVLREEAKTMGLDISRSTLIKLGCELRTKFGNDILAKKLLPKLNSTKLAVDSIRNLGEIRTLRKLPTFILLGIDSPAELRYKRIVSRSRQGDTLNYDSFCESERIENSTEDSGQQLGQCLKSADIVIINDMDIKELHKKVDRFLLEYETYMPDNWHKGQ